MRAQRGCVLQTPNELLTQGLVASGMHLGPLNLSSLGPANKQPQQSHKCNDCSVICFTLRLFHDLKQWEIFYYPTSQPGWYPNVNTGLLCELWFQKTCLNGIQLSTRTGQGPAPCEALLWSSCINVFLTQNVWVFSHMRSFVSKYPEHELGEVRASCY